MRGYHEKILLSLFLIAYFSLHAADGTDSPKDFFTSLDHLSLYELASAIGLDLANPSDAVAASSPDEETFPPAQPAIENETIIDKKPEIKVDFKKIKNKFDYYQCLHCSSQQKGIARIKEHIEVEHFRTKINQCDQCLKTFFRENDLREHKRTIHGLSRKFRCPYASCSYTSNHRGDINKHAEKTGRGVTNSTNIPEILIGRSSISILHMMLLPIPTTKTNFYSW